jgi:O-antigen/teichoic acid export membrane protein
MLETKFRNRVKQFSGMLFNGDIFEVIKHSKNYFLGDILGQGLVFLTIPIFTRLLSPAEYGTFQVFRSYAAIFLTLLTLNFHGSIARYYYDDPKDFKEFVGTSILGSFSALAIATILFLPFRQQVSDLFGISQEILVFTLLFVAIRVLDMVFNQISIASKASARYSLVNNIRTVVSYGLGIGLIFVFQGNKFYGPILGQLVAGILVSIYTVSMIRKYLSWHPTAAHVKYIFNYSVVLIPYTLSGILLDQLDRIIINRTLGAADAGLYSFAYNIGMIVSLATDALNTALVPDWFRLMKNREYERVNVLTGRVFNLTLFIALGAILFSRELVEILSDKEYHAALTIMTVVMVGYVFDALSKVYLRSIGYTNKMVCVLVVSMITVVFNFVFNIFLLPRYGYAAGAYVTVSSFFLLFVLSWWAAKFVLKQPVTPLAVFWKPSIVFTLAMVPYFFIISTNLNFFFSFISRLILFAVFVVVLALANRE